MQVNALIYSMGPEAENVFKSFRFDDAADSNKYAPVLKKFEDYFTPKRNLVHERAIFNTMSQSANESVESFIRRLYEQVENCEFKDAESEHIRDRLLVGIVDKQLSIELQRKDLTLEEYIAECRRAELVKVNVAAQAKSSQSALDEVSNGCERRGNARGRRQPSSTHKSKMGQQV